MATRLLTKIPVRSIAQAGQAIPQRMASTLSKSGDPLLTEAQNSLSSFHATVRARNPIVRDLEYSTKSYQNDSYSHTKAEKELQEAAQNHHYAQASEERARIRTNGPNGHRTIESVIESKARETHATKEQRIAKTRRQKEISAQDLEKKHAVYSKFNRADTDTFHQAIGSMAGAATGTLTHNPVIGHATKRGVYNGLRSFNNGATPNLNSEITAASSSALGQAVSYTGIPYASTGTGLSMAYLKGGKEGLKRSFIPTATGIATKAALDTFI